MNYNVVAYLFYVPMTVAVTVWVATTLFKNGRIFLIDIFHGNQELADSVNKLLVVGFYLINVGYAVFTLRIFIDILSVRQVIEELSSKLGAIILILGAMHFFNLFVFFKLRGRNKVGFNLEAK